MLLTLNNRAELRQLEPIRRTGYPSACFSLHMFGVLSLPTAWRFCGTTGRRGREAHTPHSNPSSRSLYGGTFMTLAIFDLDNTLIAGDSDHGWGQFLVEEGAVDAGHYRAMNDQFYRDYENGCLDMDAYLRFSLEPLRDLPPARLAELRARFMETVIASMWLPQAEALLEKHRAAGDFLLVVTSTNRFIVEPICQRLGVDDLIATEPEKVGERYTGRIVGVPSFREGKVTRMADWLQNRDWRLADASFYSDSINDLPLLEAVGHPVAVDPDDALRAVASERGWDIISLR